MSSQDVHILAVTTNASLVIGLTFAARDWHISSQPSAGGALQIEVADGGRIVPDVVVMEVGQVDGVAKAIAALPEGQRAVVIADAEPEATFPADIALLLRPYTVDALITRIDALLDGGSPGEGESLSDDGAGHQAAAVAEDGRDPVPLADDDPPGERTRRSLGTRLFGRLTPLARSGPRQADQPEVIDLVAIESAATDLEIGAYEGADALFGAQSPSRSTHDSDPAEHGAADAEPEATVLRHGPEPAPARKAAAGPPAPRVARWRARRQITSTREERALQERLGQVLTATGELEGLLIDLPLLTDLQMLARAIVRETAGEFGADTVALWREGRDGWYAAAQAGLTAHETTWVVPFDQPLLAELHQTGGAMLIDPIDAVPAAVAGIGGAHTRSFMAAAIAIGPGRFGILAVGRDQSVGQPELESLEALAIEVAPGLAVAEQLARLRYLLVPPHAGEGSEPTITSMSASGIER